MRFGHRFESRYFQQGNSSLLTGLSYWLAAESNANDSTPNALNFTESGSPTYPTGKIGKAFGLAAASLQYVFRADEALLRVGSSGFTTTCWVNLASKPASIMTALSKWFGDGVNDEYQVRWNNTGDRFEFIARRTGTTVTLVANNFGAPATSTWYFVACWYNSSTQTLYISVNDGTADSGSLGGAINPSGTGQAKVGRLVLATPRFWDGMIDEVGFWQRTLTASEITALYNGGSGVTYPF